MGPNILVGCTGSVGAKKLPILIESIKKRVSNANIKVVITENSGHFLDIKQVRSLSMVLTDNDEWSSWSKIGDSVLHIELRKWADMLVIAPLDVNTLAKLATGICDNLLTCVVRAWDLTKPLLFCPDMNTHMWDNPFTKEHIEKLKYFRYIELSPISKKYAREDNDLGAMAEVPSIVDMVEGICKHIQGQNSVCVCS